MFNRKQYFEVSCIERKIQYDNNGYSYEYTPVSSFLQTISKCIDAYNAEYKSKFRLLILETIDRQHAHFAIVGSRRVVEGFVTAVLQTTAISDYWAIRKIPRYMVSGE